MLFLPAQFIKATIFQGFNKKNLNE